MPDTYANLIRQLDDRNVRLVAVSKTKPVEQIMAVYEQGQRLFGENRVQELTQKQPQLPADIQWHMIGHLQTNKVKYIAPFVAMIQSVDRLKLLKEINKQAAKANRAIDCLIQVHIAEETTKHGFTFEEVEELLASGQMQAYPHVRLCGLMGMATLTDDESQIRREFEGLSAFFRKIRHHHFPDNPAFRELSMGMSGDYRTAMAAGSTMVRIGSLIFGKRET